MFESARIKLTLWYLLIIMLVSFVFSFAIYRMIVGELTSGFRRAEARLRTRSLLLPTDPNQIFFLVEELQFAKKRVVYQLLLTNAFILLGSAGASFFLAGKTLQPLKEAMENERRFIADASHELKTPLTALKSSIEVALRDKQLSLSSAKKALTANLEDVDELSDLSENLLSLSRLRKNVNGFNMTLVDTQEIYPHVRKKLAPLATHKEITLTFPPTNIQLEADEQQIIKLLIILVENAIKYTSPEGQVQVSERVYRKHAVITVTDTGEGIKQKDIPHIFDRFFRANSARTKNAVSGYGLGLSIAKQIIELHQGKISVVSKIGKGSSFIMHLPLIHSPHFLSNFSG